MEELSTRLAKLGQAVADISEQIDDPGAIQAARRRFLSSPSGEQRRRLTGPARWALATALAVACAAALLLYFRLSRALVSFAVGSPPSPGSVGEWIAAAPDAALPVRFSEGSSLMLAPGARVRITETSAQGAGVLIERGRVHANIEAAQGGAQWKLHAGPVEVRVVGTIFDAQWNPTTEIFELSMVEGSVTVRGSFLASERSVVAGDYLLISIRDKRLEVRTAKAEFPSSPEEALSAEAAASALPAAPDIETSEPADDATPKPRASASVGSPDGESRAAWQKLAEGGHYKDALAAAEREGFSKEVGRASASELLALADVARFAGSPARAREALLAARQRFGVRGKSAFLIGKIAADQQSAYGDAITWLETYLREEPGGPLAEQALGRILEIRKRSDPAGARAVAERYLARYPNGAYASVARSVLSQ